MIHRTSRPHPSRPEGLFLAAARDHVALRETTLASEVEIAIDRPLTTSEFADELRFLEDRGMVVRDHDSFDETIWSITGKGELALKGL